MNPRLAERIADRVVRATRRLQDAPMWIRSLPARAHRARNPQQWITVIDSTGVTPFWPHEDGELAFQYGCHRSEGPVLIEGKTFYAQPHPLVRFQILKLFHEMPANSDALLVTPRTRGAVEREQGEEVELRWHVKRSAFPTRSPELMF